MGFIRIFPFTEIENFSEEQFGKGHPARCKAQTQFGSKEMYLNVAENLAFEVCPLYLVSEAETDALVNGIRIQLRSGDFIIVPDDTEHEDRTFLYLLTLALKGEIVEMDYSLYLRQLEQRKLI